MPGLGCHGDRNLHLHFQEKQEAAHVNLQDWNYFKSEFIKLGGYVENTTCREGENGRGMFVENNCKAAKILCPPKLLAYTEDVILVSGKLCIKEESKHTQEAKEFLEAYYQNFSWKGCIEEDKKFLNEINEMPKEAKIIISNNNLCPRQLLHCEPKADLLLDRFIGTRRVRCQKKSVLAPIWELVNHSPFAKSFKTSSNGVETTHYPIDRTDNQLFHAYTLSASPLSIFFDYGFYSDEVVAYSIPLEMRSRNLSLVIRVKGETRGIEKKNQNITLEDNTLTIPGLPVGSISRELPIKFLSSITQKHGISVSESLTLIRKIQQHNLDQRKKLEDILSFSPNSTTKTLIKSINREIKLIENTI